MLLNFFPKIRLGTKTMKHNFSGRLGGEFLGVMEHLRRLSCFPERNVFDKHYFVFHFSKPSLYWYFRLSRLFFHKWNWFVQTVKCDSGTKFTNPEFCLPFTQTVNQPVCPCKWCTTIAYLFSRIFPISATPLPLSAGE